MDKITIKNLKIFAYHGVLAEEKATGQDFIFDIDYYANLTRACHNDDLSDTISYADVVALVQRVFTAKSYDLIERAAQVVADAIFEEFEPIAKVEITLKKPNAPVDANFDYMAVTIVRERQFN